MPCQTTGYLGSPVPQTFGQPEVTGSIPGHSLVELLYFRVLFPYTCFNTHSQKCSRENKRPCRQMDENVGYCTVVLV